MDFRGTSIPCFVRTIETLNVEIKTTTIELESIVKHEPVCQLLMSIPGVGPITSLAGSVSVRRYLR
ncbi:MAG: hypothetical protein AAFU77_03795 [Myxococcota bacterium]